MTWLACGLAHDLNGRQDVDRHGVLTAARELYRQRNYPQVVAACRAELGVDPTNVDLRLLLARALMALRRDGEAQLEVAAVLKQRSRCPEAYALLGELAFRRDELKAAEIFLREAVRQNPADAHSQVLIDIIGAMNKPAAAAAKLPAASAAAGPSSSPSPRFRAVGTIPAGAIDGEAEATHVATRGVESVALRLNSGTSGFGEFLVWSGVLTRSQLFQALQVHDRTRCKLGEAVVRLGFASREKVERSARSYHQALQGALPRRAVA